MPCCLIALLSIAPLHSHGQEERALTALEIHQWTKLLSSSDWVQQAVALEHLGKWKVEQSTPAIRKIFEHGKSSWIKGRAMLTLAKIQGEALVPDAKKAALHSDPILRKAALETLDLVGGETSGPVALKLLQDTNMEVRAMAAALYARQHPEEAWPTVERLTPPDQREISNDLLKALAHVGSDEALARLEILFHAPNGNNRRKREVMQALAVADDESIPLLVRLTVHFSPGQVEFQLGQKLLASRTRAKVSETLRKMLLVEETKFLANTASLMTAVCPTRELGDLLSVSWMKRKDLPQKAIQAALMALSKIEPSSYKEFFTHYLQSEDPITRAMAVRCRGLIPDKDLFETFRVYVHDEHSEVARVALKSLQRAPWDSKPKEGLLEYLAQSFESEEESVLLSAIDLLGQRGVAEDFEPALLALKPFLKEEKGVKREAAAQALAKLSRYERNADIATAQGYVGRWEMVGPFLNDNRNSGFEKKYGPEEQEDAETYKAEYRWEFGGGKANDRELELFWTETMAQTTEGAIHVAAQMPVPIRHAVAYAKVDLYSESEQSVRFLLEIRERTSQKVWLNDQVVTDLTTQHNDLGGTPEERRAGGPYRIKTIKVDLKKGSNRLMIKTSTFGGRWWMALRIMDGKKREIASGITLALSKP
ncbi:MAG: hypothetical protein CMI30_08965 [Opitutae bacterium]|nr:hypothetical protein [Opitutae bacterium]